MNNMFRVRANTLAKDVTVGETVYLGLVGCVASIESDLIDVGGGRVLPGEKFVTICVEQVVKARCDVGDPADETFHVQWDPTL